MHQSPPRRNPRMTVILVAIGFTALTAAITLVIVLSGGASARGGTAAGTSTSSRPTVTLPRGCGLLTAAQIATLIPGEVDTSISSGPVVSNELSQSECEWGNWHDPNSASLPYVDLHVKVTVVATEEVLQNTMHFSLGCQAPNPSAPKVAGAEETCVTNSVTDPTTGAAIDQADVTARKGKLVVELHYNYDGMPINIINVTATNTAADVLSAILK